MSEKPPETQPPERPTTSVVDTSPTSAKAAEINSDSVLDKLQSELESLPRTASKAEPERMPPPVPPRASRTAPPPSYQPASPAPPPYQAAAPNPAFSHQAASVHAPQAEAGRAWRILSHAATIRGWAIVWLAAIAMTALVRETLFALGRYLYIDTLRLRFLYDILPLTLLLLVVGAVVVRRAARSISIEFAPGERGPESEAARTAATWATAVLAVAVIAMAIRYVAEYSVLSGNVDVFYFDLQYRLEQWLHRVLGIFVVVASILLLQRMGPLVARQRGLVSAAARPAPASAAYYPLR